MFNYPHNDDVDNLNKADKIVFFFSLFLNLAVFLNR